MYFVTSHLHLCFISPLFYFFIDRLHIFHKDKKRKKRKEKKEKILSLRYGESQPGLQRGYQECGCYTPGRGKIVPRNYTPGIGKIVPCN